VSNIPSTVAPSVLTWLGIGREAAGAAGTPVAPVATIPLDQGSYQPEDTPIFLPDDAIRGAMAKTYAEILGVEDATFSYGGPVFGDVYGYFLDNVFGDLSTIGTATAGGSSTVSGALTAGATTLTAASGTGFSIGQFVQVAAGSTAEVVKLSNVTGPTLTFTTTPLRFAHSTAVALHTVIGPYTHVFASLNSGNGQPPTHTVTDYTGLTPTVGARAYPSLCVAQLDFTGNAERLFEAKVSGNSWVSTPAGAKPTNTTTFTVPIPNWRSTVTIGGSPLYDVGEWTISIKRQLQVYYTNQGFQNPYIIARGPLDVTGTINYAVVSDESPLTQMLNNTQPSAVIAVNNGLSTTNQISYSFDIHQCAFIKAKPERSSVLFGYQDEYVGVANATDVGGSGGLGPIKVTVINNYPTY
jgi:hypothetical protein